MKALLTMHTVTSNRPSPAVALNKAGIRQPVLARHSLMPACIQSNDAVRRQMALGMPTGDLLRLPALACPVETAKVGRKGQVTVGETATT